MTLKLLSLRLNPVSNRFCIKSMKFLRITYVSRLEILFFIYAAFQPTSKDSFSCASNFVFRYLWSSYNLYMDSAVFTNTLISGFIYSFVLVIPLPNLIAYSIVRDVP